MNYHKPMQLILLFALCSWMGGCKTERNSGPSQDGNDRIVLMLNWYPEAEHGGFYAADVHGVFDRFGLDVEIRPGGPSAPVAQELVAGRIQFAIGNADDVLVFREQNVPVVALMAPIQNTPRCILVHKSSSAENLAELEGLTMQAGAGRPFLTFMESKGLLQGVHVVPYSGVPMFATNSQSAIQAYSFSEPLLARQQGAEVRVMMLSEIGFNPYASCLIAQEEYIEQNRDIVSRMVVACREGWRKYLESPEETNAAILAANEHGMTEETLAFGVQELRPLCLPEGISPDNIGVMDANRWQTLVNQFIELKLINGAKVTANSVYTTEFIDRSAPTE